MQQCYIDLETPSILLQTFLLIVADTNSTQYFIIKHVTVLLCCDIYFAWMQGILPQETNVAAILEKLGDTTMVPVILEQ